MPSQIPLDKAYLTAIWLETLFYGINFVLFWACLFVFTYKKKSADINKVLVGVAVAQYLLSTVHVSLGFSRLITGFISLREKPGGPAAFFSDVSIPANVAKVTIHTVNSVVGDSIVVWRCYLVWGKSWLAASLPIILVTASAICGLAQAIYFARAKTVHSAFNIELVHWNGALFSLSLATNVIGTGLIAFRVWSLLRLSSGVGQAHSRYGRVLALIIESGMVYSASLIIEITLYFLGSNAFYIIYDPIAQLTSIVPTMILLLVGLKLTSNDLNSRMTKNSHFSKNKGPISNPRFRSATTATAPDTMDFAIPTDLLNATQASRTSSDYDMKVIHKPHDVQIHEV